MLGDNLIKIGNSLEISAQKTLRCKNLCYVTRAVNDQVQIICMNSTKVARNSSIATMCSLSPLRAYSPMSDSEDKKQTKGVCSIDARVRKRFEYMVKFTGVASCLFDCLFGRWVGCSFVGVGPLVGF